MEPGGRPHLSVVIPAFNEERRLGATLERIAAYLRDASIDAELLVVDDGSRDATADVAAKRLRDVRGRLIRSGENRGKGHAVRRGVLEARGRWVLMTDADLSAPIEEHARLADAVRDLDLDVAIGSRAVHGARIEVRQNPVRETMGKIFNGVVRGATGLAFRDTQCGFKLMDRGRVLPLFRQMVVDRFAFDVELLFLCMKFGLRVREVPVAWSNSPASGVNLVTDPLNMLWDVARMRWRFRRGAYDPAAARDDVAG
jgi:glycosyltransferase involved in cell wall biosynthesis